MVPAVPAATAASVLALLLVACAGEAPDEPREQGGPGAWFHEVTQQTGLDFRHSAGRRDDYHTPEITGSGGALFDADGDGDLDVYLIDAAADGASPNRLYAQQPDGRFDDVTAASGLGDPGYGMGAALGDVDNDGDLDLFVTNYGPDRLYLNRGDGTFEDVSDGYALARYNGRILAGIAKLDLSEKGEARSYFYQIRQKMLDLNSTPWNTKALKDLEKDMNQTENKIKNMNNKIDNFHNKIGKEEDEVKVEEHKTEISALQSEINTMTATLPPMREQENQLRETINKIKTESHTYLSTIGTL